MLRITKEDFSKAFEDVMGQKDSSKAAETAPMPGMPDMNEIMKTLPQKDKDKIKDKLEEVESREEKVGGGVKKRSKEVGKKK